MYLFVYSFIYLFIIYLLNYLFIHLFIFNLFNIIFLLIYLFYLFIYLFTYLFTYLFIMHSSCHLFIQKMQHRSSWELCDYYRQTDSLYIHAMILHILLKREGALWRLDDITVEQRLERVCRRGGNHQHWYVDGSTCNFYPYAASG